MANRRGLQALSIDPSLRGPPTAYLGGIAKFSRNVLQHYVQKKLFKMRMKFFQECLHFPNGIAFLSRKDDILAHSFLVNLHFLFSNPSSIERRERQCSNIGTRFGRKPKVGRVDELACCLVIMIPWTLACLSRLV